MTQVQYPKISGKVIQVKIKARKSACVGVCVSWNHSVLVFTSLLTFEISLELSVSRTTVQGHSHPAETMETDGLWKEHCSWNCKPGKFQPEVLHFLHSTHQRWSIKMDLLYRCALKNNL